jgi:hypothetical protein
MLGEFANDTNGVAAQSRRGVGFRLNRGMFHVKRS